MIELRPYQAEAVAALFAYFERSDGHPLVEMPTACHAPGTRVLDWRGRPVAVEDVREGDRLLGVDGSPRTVLRLSRGVGEMFEITPIRGGKPFVVNGDHVLSLMTTNEGKRFACCTTGKTIDNITVNEYLRKPKSWKHLRKLYRSSGVSFDCSREPEIDPYFLGVLLGDGSTQWSIGVTTADSEIEDCVRNEAARWGLSVTVSTKTNNKARSLYLTTRPGARNTLLRMVRSLGIDVECGQKFVPDHYKRGSVSTRRAVLAGLMDTDGHSHLGGFDFVSKSRTLADDVSYIARSLGLAAHVVECRKGCQTGAVGTYWRVSISGDCSIIPVRLARKIPKPRKMKKRPTVTGFSVKPVGRGEFFGFTLDGDHLYHLDDFTITHNSGKSLTMAGFVKDAITAFPDTRVLLATHRKELIEQDAAAIRKLWPDAPAGIYSAGLHSRQVRRITVAGVQTVHKKAAELGHVSLLLVDECFTAETLIETTRGLVRIDNVRPGDYVYCATGIGEIRAVRSRPASDVVTVRFADGHKVRCTPDHRFFTADGWIPARQLAGKVPLDQEAVRLLREGVWPNSLDQLSRQRARDERGAMEQASVLLAILREEDEKPDEQQSGTAQDESAAPGDQAQADQTWWERTTVPALTTGTSPRAGRGMGGRGGSSGWNGEGERLPDLLQDRHRQRREENRDRSRRREPLRDREARTGCKEDGFSRLPRVVSVSREQRGSVEAVFNLHVSGHPSYFANGRLVHNCHLIPHAGDGMYRRLIRDLTEINPALKIVGFTATPYRLSGGLLTRGAGHIFTSIAYKIPVQRLVDEGWLSPLVSPSTSTTYSTEGIGTVNGDFAVGELQSSVDKQEAVTRAALAESLELAKDRRAGIVFCVSVQHAQLATAILRERGETCAMITGDTDDLTRSSMLSKFKRGEVRWLVGIDVLTTGFDAPITDVIVILRPTQSAGLYTQVAGRGMRLYDGKKDCIAEGSLVLTDHGEVPIENVSPEMKVWDGSSFVRHGGAILRGTRPVVSYCGLTATVDHRVWTPLGWRTLGQCIESKIPLAVTSEGGRPIREADHHFVGDEEDQARDLPSSDVHGVRSIGVVAPGKPQEWGSGVQALWSSETRPQVATGTHDLRAAEVQESKRLSVQQIRRARDPLSVQDPDGCVSLDHGEHRHVQGYADRPDRQRQRIRAGEPPMVDTGAKPGAHEKASCVGEGSQVSTSSPGNHVRGFNLEESLGEGDEVQGRNREVVRTFVQAERRVWDILDCGPLHRFTVSGRLVHNCLVLDYGGNVERHGPITDIRHKSLAAGESKMVKECPNCMAEVKISKRECPECGFIFPEQPRDIDHDKQASRKAIMGPAPEPVWVEIDDVRASEWVKRAKEGEAPKPPTVCVEYLRSDRAVVKEWLCPEHGGYAAQKFCRWWFEAGGDLPAPHTVALALERIEAGELKRIEAVQVGKDGQYDRVLARRFAAEQTMMPVTEAVIDDDPLPF